MSMAPSGFSVSRVADFARPTVYSNVASGIFERASAGAEAYDTRRPAAIEVTVPPGASISFNSARTVQAGVSRRFISPPLDTGTEYVYRLRVSWGEGGRQQERTKEVTVHAGDQIHLDFTPVTVASR
jgi:uncharacterized protein (TIGR03000 family)